MSLLPERIVFSDPDAAQRPCRELSFPVLPGQHATLMCMRQAEWKKRDGKSNQVSRKKIVKVAMPVSAGTMTLFSGKSASNRDPGTRVV
jgi:hypothetical protein